VYTTGDLWRWEFNPDLSNLKAPAVFPTQREEGRASLEAVVCFHVKVLRGDHGYTLSGAAIISAVHRPTLVLWQMWNLPWHIQTGSHFSGLLTGPGPKSGAPKKTGVNKGCHFLLLFSCPIYTLHLSWIRQ
jgi:hypothetical protein